MTFVTCGEILGGVSTLWVQRLVGIPGDYEATIGAGQIQLDVDWHSAQSYSADVLCEQELGVFLITDLLVDQLNHCISKRVSESNEEGAAAEIVIRAVTADRIPFMEMLRPAFLEDVVGVQGVLLVAFDSCHLVGDSQCFGGFSLG